MAYFFFFLIPFKQISSSNKQYILEHFFSFVAALSVYTVHRILHPCLALDDVCLLLFIVFGSFYNFVFFSLYNFSFCLSCVHLGLLIFFFGFCFKLYGKLKEKEKETSTKFQKNLIAKSVALNSNHVKNIRKKKNYVRFTMNVHQRCLNEKNEKNGTKHFKESKWLWVALFYHTFVARQFRRLQQITTIWKICALIVLNAHCACVQIELKICQSMSPLTSYILLWHLQPQMNNELDGLSARLERTAFAHTKNIHMPIRKMRWKWLFFFLFNVLISQAFFCVSIWIWLMISQKPSSLCRLSVRLPFFHCCMCVSYLPVCFNDAFISQSSNTKMTKALKTK